MCILLYSTSDKNRADVLTTERRDSDGTASSLMSNGSSRRELEEVAAFCEMTAGCRKELLYSHFGFNFDISRCVRNCNCGVALENTTELWRDQEIEDTDMNIKKTRTVDEEGISKGTIEYQYQKVLTESKKLGLPKREALSRRLIRDILETEPTSEEEMASMRGIGPAKAARFYSLFRFS
ncbi:ATP-dependent DNA helicase Q4 [Phytophthora boehmeriae]|uniref:ATP-dependent DNA helicase Q4 n=1 Tax=Phytophthora boehmeriae TaxID=109152 RepID=A0A8T1VRL6_9STRA|nr:ATP-dependent DNA helicase Q4 [Phytophthora boehmeriae]